MTGFTLSWFLEDSNSTKLTEKLPARAEDWKKEVPTPNYEEPLLTEIVQVARQLRLQNLTREEILEEVIPKKLRNTNILETEGMCTMGQIKPQHQKEAFSKLFSDMKMNETEEFTTMEDIKTGYQIFHVIVYCPTMVMKLYRFIYQLLLSESSRTIIQTFVNLFQSRAVTDRTSFTLAKQFYHILASTLNLQYGNVLLATMSNEDLQAFIRHDWPFFGNNTDLIEKCLQGSNCDGIRGIFQKIGNVFICCNS